MAKKQKEAVDFTTRALMAMATDMAEAEALVARVGLHFRSLAKEHGVSVPDVKHIV
jgi:hypothetical protein